MSEIRDLDFDETLELLNEWVGSDVAVIVDQRLPDGSTSPLAIFAGRLFELRMEQITQGDAISGVAHYPVVAYHGGFTEGVGPHGIVIDARTFTDADHDAKTMGDRGLERITIELGRVVLNVQRGLPR